LKKAEEKKKAAEKILEQRKNNYLRIINNGSRVFKK